MTERKKSILSVHLLVFSLTITNRVAAQRRCSLCGTRSAAFCRWLENHFPWSGYEDVLQTCLAVPRSHSKTGICGVKGRSLIPDAEWLVLLLFVIASSLADCVI